MSTKQWIISEMGVKNQEDTLQDIVIIIYWSRQATEVDGGKTYSTETTGTLTLLPPDPQNFTPYNQLTKQQVEGWLDELLPVSNIDSILDDQINQQKHPQTSVLPLPWDTTIS